MKEREDPPSQRHHSKLSSKEQRMYKSHSETLLKPAARLMNHITHREKAEDSLGRIPASVTLWPPI